MDTRQSARHRARLPWLGALVAAGLALGLPGVAQAKDYYVATTGSDSSAGTLEQPFATLQKGANVAMPGDTVYIRAGTYRVVTPAASYAGISFTRSGTSDTNRIRFWAYPGERPVFDFADLRISTTGYTAGFSVSGSWLHFKGFEITNVPMNTRSNNGMSVSDASNNIFELIDFHHNKGTGLFIGEGNGGHLVLNCDSHDNYDPDSTQGDGQNADGFGLHYQTSGAVSTFRGCRAWWNSDDGYDFISQEVPGVIENSWAFRNGYINSGAGRPADGNGTGFKVGSSKTGIRHVVRHNLAWANRANGFYANHSSGGNDWFNNTSYNNGTQYNLWASTWDAAGNRTDGVVLTGAKAHRMRNNIGFPDKNMYMEGVDTAFNTWDLDITPATSDFVSVDDTGAMGPREPDGSLPNLDLLKLRAGSPLIDKGTDVELEFAGAAPDLGALELGLTATGGQGGGSGASGSSGDGGVTGSSGSASGTAGATNEGGGTSTAGTASAAGGVTVAAGGSAGFTAGASYAAADDGVSDSGCSCRMLGKGSRRGLFESLGVLCVGVALRLRRKRPAATETERVRSQKGRDSRSRRVHHQSKHVPIS
jgi:hypothetical protein